MHRHTLIQEFVAKHPDVNPSELLSIGNALVIAKALGNFVPSKTSLQTLSRGSLNEVARVLKLKHLRELTRAELENKVLMKYNSVMSKKNQTVINTDSEALCSLSACQSLASFFASDISYTDNHDLMSLEQQSVIEMTENDFNKTEFLYFMFRALAHLHDNVYRNIKFSRNKWTVFFNEQWQVCTETEINNMVEIYYKVIENSVSSIDVIDLFIKLSLDKHLRDKFLQRLKQWFKRSLQLCHGETPITIVPPPPRAPTAVDSVKRIHRIELSRLQITSKAELHELDMLLFNRTHCDVKRFQMSCNALSSSTLMMERVVHRTGYTKTEIINVLETSLKTVQNYLPEKRSRMTREEHLLLRKLCDIPVDNEILKTD
jgi:hypothetical protein